jgi:hypothetical protein
VRFDRALAVLKRVSSGRAFCSRVERKRDHCETIVPTPLTRGTLTRAPAFGWIRNNGAISAASVR